MKLVPLSKLAEKGVCYSRNYRDSRIKDGLLPKPVALSPRKRAFIEDELDRVIAARVAGKSDEEIRTLVHQMAANREVAA